MVCERRQDAKESQVSTRRGRRWKVKGEECERKETYSVVSRNVESSFEEGFLDATRERGREDKGMER